MEHDGHLSYSQVDTTSSLSWARWIHSTLFRPNSLSYIWMLPSLLRLGLPSRLFPAGCLTKSLYLFVVLIRATCLTILTLFISINLLTLVEHVSAASVAQSTILKVLMRRTLSPQVTGLRLSGHVDQVEYTENRTFLKSQSSNKRLGEGFSSSGVWHHVGPCLLAPRRICCLHL